MKQNQTKPLGSAAAEEKTVPLQSGKPNVYLGLELSNRGALNFVNKNHSLEMINLGEIAHSMNSERQNDNATC